MAYANGLIPREALIVVQSGLYLTPLAAASWRVVAAGVRGRYGWTPVLSDAYRAMDGPYGQVATFLRRYQRTYIQYSPGRVDRRVWNGVPYWRKPGEAAAAVPGTSNHGWGVAVDVAGLGDFGSPRHQQFATVAGPLGWSDVEGRAVDEPWHWTKSSASFASNPTQGISGSVPVVPTLDPVDPIDPVEDDMTPEQDQLMRDIDARTRDIESRVRGGDPNADMLQLIKQGTDETWQRVRGTAQAVDSFQALQMALGAARAELGALLAAVAAISPAGVDQGELAAKVTQSLVPAVVAALGADVGLSADEVTAATEKAVRNVLGGLG